MKKAFFFAHIKEAEPFLKQTKAKKVTDTHYTFASFHVFISGMGALSTLWTMKNLPSLPEEIWNLGIAGSLQEHYEIGTILPIKQVEKAPFFPQSTLEHAKDFFSKVFPPLSIELDGVKLISSDFPLHDSTTKKTLAKHGDLIDMEGYAFAYAAKKLQVPLFMRKAISDPCAESGIETLQKQLPILSQKLANLAIEEAL